MSRPFGDREAHVGEDLGDLVDHLADRMDAPVLRGPARTGSVTSARSLASRAASAPRSSVGLARLERLADALP